MLKGKEKTKTYMHEQPYSSLNTRNNTLCNFSERQAI